MRLDLKLVASVLITLVSFADLLDTYDKLNRYAIKHNIKLVNSSAETIITSIP